MVKSPVSSSLTTAAVKPAADEALPDVYTARGRKEHMYLHSVLASVTSKGTIQLDLLQKLTLTRTRITNNTHIDITT